MKKFKWFVVFLLSSFFGCVKTNTPTENNEHREKKEENVLSIYRSSYDSFKIMLDNSEEIYGLSFRISASSNVVLKELVSSFLTFKDNWNVGYYNVNDSVMQVLIINLFLKHIPIGSGCIAEVSFDVKKENPIFSIFLNDVILTNKNADSLSVVVKNLEGKLQ